MIIIEIAGSLVVFTYLIVPEFTLIYIRIMNGSKTKAIVSVFLWAMPLTFLMLTGYALIGQFPPFSDKGIFGIPVGLTAFIAVIMIVSIFVLQKPFFVKNNIFWIIVAALVFGIVSSAYLVGHALFSSGHAWDAGVVEMLARHYIDYGTTDLPDNFWEDNYLTKYSNNVAITLLLTIVFKLSQIVGLGYFGAVSQLLNSLCLVAAVFLTAYSAYRLFGRRALSLTLIFGYLLVILSPFAAVTYSDTIGAFVVALLIAIVVIASRSKATRRSLLLVLFGSVLCFGILIKPNIIFIIISLAVVVILYILKNQNNTISIKQYLILPGSIILGFMIFLLSYNLVLNNMPGFAKYSPAEYERYHTPIEHFLGMGSLRGLEPYSYCTSGGYCADMVDWVYSSNGLATVNERKNYGLSLWKSSVETDFPFGYSGLVLNKLSVMFSDGSFGVWQEGAGLNDKINFKNQSSLDQWIREFMGPTGSHLGGFRSLLNMVWLALVIIIVVGTLVLFFRRRVGRSFWLDAFMTIIIMQVVFLMVFESRPRYLFLYLPVFILLAVGLLSVNLDSINKLGRLLVGKKT